VCFDGANKGLLTRYDTLDFYNPKTRNRGPCKGYSCLFRDLWDIIIACDSKLDGRLAVKKDVGVL